MKTILVPTDFSEVSKNALDFAIQIAQPIKAKIVLFHSNPPILIASEMGDYVYSMPMEAEQTAEVITQMNELLAHIEEQGVKCEKVIDTGILEDAIAGIVNKNKANLIVTGMHDVKGLDRLFFGTNSMRMFEGVDCPVLIIPSKAKFHGIKKIMYATEFQFGDVNELKKVCRLATFFDASVMVVHIVTEPSKINVEEEKMEWLEEMEEDHISYDKLSYKTIHNHDVYEGLAQIIEFWDIDLLCMSTVGKSFFKKLVSKSNIKEMAFHAKVPLMAIHLQEENKLV